MEHLDPQVAPSGAVVAEFPVTTTQERCWFLDQINPGEPALNVAVRWELRGKIQAGDLARAFAHVIERHEILRTRIVARDGVPMQQVMEAAPFRLGELDLRTTPADDRPARIEAIAEEEAARPFDLTQPGLIRATLVRFDQDRAMLLIVAHQSVFDGYSIGVLGREVGAAAAAIQAGGTPDLPDLPLQYGDFALWQKEYFASGILEEEGAYWQRTLADLPYFEVPPDRSRPARAQTAVVTAHRPLPANFAERLKSAAQRAGVTPFVFGTAVVGACLHRLTGTSEVVMGTQIAGRMDVDLDPLIGVFINNLVLRQTTDPQRSMADQIALARGVVEGALAHQSMPFNRLVELLNPPRDASRNPLISVNFNLLEVFMQGARYGTFELISVPSHAPGSVYDLEIVAIGRPEGGWRLNVEYRPDLFEAETIEQLLGLVEAGFTTAFEAPDTRLCDLPLAPALAQRATPDETRSHAAKVLEAHPMVGEATVVAGPEGPWAFVTPGETGLTPFEDLPAILVHYVSGLVPENAAICGVSVLAALPRTAHGAVQTALLQVPTGRAAPRAVVPIDPEVEAALRKDWQEILGIGDIPPAASFFDLGGHSLLVVRLLARIKARHDLSLGIAAIYENPTFPALARMISARVAPEVPVETVLATTAEPQDWRVLRLHREGKAAPFVAVNNAATALGLASLFEHERPVTCVRVFEDGKGLDVTNMAFEEIAGAYAHVIREAHRDGPYLLYGNCVHGNLALEAARHLTAAGAEVTGVVMKDVWEPGYTARLLADRNLRKREKRHALRVRLRMVRDGRMSLGALLGSYRIIRKTGILQIAQWVGLIDRVRLSDLEADQERFIATVSSARDRYRPVEIDVPVLHVVTSITPQARGFSPSIGWEDVVRPGRLRTVTLDNAYVHKDQRVGLDAMAGEIEHFLTR